MVPKGSNISLTSAEPQEAPTRSSLDDRVQSADCSEKAWIAKKGHDESTMQRKLHLFLPIAVRRTGVKDVWADAATSAAQQQHRQPVMPMHEAPLSQPGLTHLIHHETRVFHDVQRADPQWQWRSEVQFRGRRRSSAAETAPSTLVTTTALPAERRQHCSACRQSQRHQSASFTSAVKHQEQQQQQQQRRKSLWQTLVLQQEGGHGRRLANVSLSPPVEAFRRLGGARRRWVGHESSRNPELFIRDQGAPPVITNLDNYFGRSVKLTSPSNASLVRRGGVSSSNSNNICFWVGASASAACRLADGPQDSNSPQWPGEPQRVLSGGFQRAVGSPAVTMTAANAHFRLSNEQLSQQQHSLARRVKLECLQCIEPNLDSQAGFLPSKATSFVEDAGSSINSLKYIFPRGRSLSGFGKGSCGSYVRGAASSSFVSSTTETADTTASAATSAPLRAMKLPTWFCSEAPLSHQPTTLHHQQPCWSTSELRRFNGSSLSSHGSCVNGFPAKIEEPHVFQQNCAAPFPARPCVPPMHYQIPMITMPLR